MQGFAVRAPTPTVSLVDLTIEVESVTSVSAVNVAIPASGDGAPRLDATPPSSTDLGGSSYSSMLAKADDGLSMVPHIMVVAWYDNEWLLKPAFRRGTGPARSRPATAGR